MEDSEIMLDEEEQEILKELKKQGKNKADKNKESDMQKLLNMIEEQEEKIEENHEMLPDAPRNDGGGNLNTENS
jgi:hypothetical protein